MSAEPSFLNSEFFNITILNKLLAGVIITQVFHSQASPLLLYHLLDTSKKGKMRLILILVLLVVLFFSKNLRGFF